jgi:hypothetical protein
MTRSPPGILERLTRGDTLRLIRRALGEKAQATLLRAAQRLIHVAHPTNASGNNRSTR